MLLVLLNKILHFEKELFTSITGGIRFNTYVFLAFVDAAYGDKGLILAAIVMALPFLLSIFCVFLFLRFIHTQWYVSLSFLRRL